MVERVIGALIWIAVVVGLVWLSIWVIGMLGLSIPAMVINVIWVIAVLVITVLGRSYT